MAIKTERASGATITDVEKLRPELLTKSLAELERQRAELDMAIERKRREAEVAEKQALAADANGHIEAVLAGVGWLHRNGLLPERLATALTGGNGAFMPASFLRAVSAESLVGGPRPKPAGERKTRRRRDPVTGELVPSKASLQK